MESMAQAAFQQRIAELAERVRRLNPELFAGVSQAELLARTAAQVADAQRLGITSRRDTARYVDMANRSPGVADPNSPIMNNPRRTPEERMRMASMKSSMAASKPRGPGSGGSP
jgi:hypothetical protein